MDALKIVLDHLPDSQLSPNSRGHWSAKHRASQEAVEEVIALVRQQGWFRSPLYTATIGIEFHAPDERRRDFDNLLAASKPWIDGLVRAGVLVDDDAGHVRYKLSYTSGGSETSGTVITIEEREA